MPKLAVGGSIKTTLYDPCFRSTTLYKASRLLTACFTFSPGEISVEINPDPGITDVRVHPHPGIRGVTCHRRPFPGMYFCVIFADDNTLYVTLRGLQFLQSTCRYGCDVVCSFRRSFSCSSPYPLRHQQVGRLTSGGGESSWYLVSSF